MFMFTPQGLVSTTPWLSSTQHKGKDIVISGNTVTKTAQSWGTGTAIVSDGITLKHGSSVKKRWSFTIKKGTQQTIALVTSAYNATTDQYANKTTKGWGFYQSNGNKGHGGPANTAYASKYNVGDTVDGMFGHTRILNDLHLFSFVPDTMCCVVGIVLFGENCLYVWNSASVFGHS